MQRILVIVLALSLGIAAATLVACGQKKGKLLTPASADALIEELDRIEARFDADDCSGAELALAGAEDNAAALPENTDQNLRDSIDESLQRLGNLLQEECAVTTATTTRTQPKTVTVETETVETVTTEETPTKTTPVKTVPDDGGSGNNDGSNGNDGGGNEPNPPPNNGGVSAN